MKKQIPSIHPLLKAGHWSHFIIGENKMRILIVDHDLFSRKKLTELLSPYGTCESVARAGGGGAIDRFAQAVSENRPYGLVTLDTELTVNGYELLNRLRTIQSASAVPPAQYIMVGPPCGQEDIAQAVLHRCAGYLVKPITREKALHILQTMNLMEPALVAPPSTISAVGGEGPTTKIVEPEWKSETLRSLLIAYVRDNTPDIIKGLNQWLKEPNKEIEKEISELLLSKELEDYDKVQILRWLQGYPKLELVPLLGRLMEVMSNPRQKKEILIMLSKCESIDALHELNRLKDTLLNSMLKGVAVSEVNRLRMQYPSLALMERFLLSGKDQFALKNVLTLLHKHLSSQQVAGFRRYLHHEQETLLSMAKTVLPMILV